MNIQIQDFITVFNSAWMERDFEKLSFLLHPNVIFTSPDFQTELKGSEECVQSIMEYMNIATTKSFSVKNIKIDSWNSSASVILEYEMEYSIEKQVFCETGTELWILTQQEKEWKLVRRYLLKNERKGNKLTN
jgi:hypothetical protein